ncbi:MAG TPA: sigma-E factor negative regulatory protein [Burkholderiaceae bacterium]|nr:sigma-E factor negative regulatory protein [Burkholderiaceae bacterium]
MSQKVSLLLDSQLDAEEVARVLKDLGTDDVLRDRFTIYGLIGDAMRGVNVPDDGFSKRIFARLRRDGVKIEDRYDPLA